VSRETVTAVEEAIRAHMADTGELANGEVLVDWVVGTTAQRVDDDASGEFDPIWINSYFTSPMGNPNAHAYLAGWVEGEIDELLHMGEVGYHDE
jgi:hypothetical protein